MHRKNVWRHMDQKEIMSNSKKGRMRGMKRKAGLGRYRDMKILWLNKYRPTQASTMVKRCINSPPLPRFISKRIKNVDSALASLT